jgi:hypothetical protein
VTSNPTAGSIWQQVVEATPWGRRPDYLIHDLDAVYGRDLAARLSKLGITRVRTPFGHRGQMPSPSGSFARSDKSALIT